MFILVVGKPYSNSAFDQKRRYPITIRGTSLNMRPWKQYPNTIKESLSLGVIEKNVYIYMSSNIASVYEWLL